MLIDARRLGGEKLKARVCVIGSGMGGASVAKKLVEAGVGVLIVEAGGPEQRGRALPRVQHQIAGKDFGLPMTRVLELGGTTNAWHGICASLDPIDFQVRDWISHSGWPISHQDLQRHYTDAAKWLGVSNQLETPADSWPNLQRQQRTLVAKAFWTPYQPARMKDDILRWVRKRQARCLVHAVALELRADEGGVVRSLIVGCGDRIVEIEAEVFVIATGGLESPRLLLNSAKRSQGRFQPGGDLAGRYLMDHPTGYFSQVIFRHKTSNAFGEAPHTGRGYLMGLRLVSNLQSQFRLPNHYIFLRPGVGPGRVPNHLLRGFLGVRRARDLSLHQVATIITNRYIVQRVIRERFGNSVSTRYGDIYVMAEQLPNPNSRVTLSADRFDDYGYPIARVDWTFHKDEWDHFSTFFSLVASGLREEEGICAIRLDAVEQWPREFASAAHHLGTARMAAIPTQGVVDAELRVFGCKNLFICDGSVFPTSGGTNPTLTICALGLRLGDTLLKSLGPASVQAA